MPADSSDVTEHDLTEPAASFAALGVPAPLVDVLDHQGITAPFPVQAAVLPDALAGRDILGRARTGSGKTLGFSLPLVTALAGGSTASRKPRGLILVPTRELATQVTAVLRPLARAMGQWVTTIYGGVPYGPQVSALQHKTDIVVATPGRLADLIGQRECDLSDVKVTVIDEADQMADLGFLPIVRRLLETTPDQGQRMLFSATLDADVDVLARRFLSDPVLHSVDENSNPAEIEHHLLTVEAASRVAVVAALAGGEQRSLVFTKTKHGAERLARQLTEAGIPAAELHGNLRQGARSRNLDAFASGLARVMVATDIAARGIHIDAIDLIIHADPPAEHKSYVHRSGRTARGGAGGVVVALQTKGQVRDVAAMMRKADITPHAAVTVDPGSALLAELAGPPAPRVAVAGKVAGLVQPEDRLASNDRRGAGKSWEGRPRRDHKPRDDRFAGHGPRTSGPRNPGPGGSGPQSYDRGHAEPAGPGARPGLSERPAAVRHTDGDARTARFDRNERAAEGERYNRDSHGGRRFQPSDRTDRGDHFNRGERGDRGERRFQPGDRGVRSNPGERGVRGARSDRPAQGDRFDRTRRFDGGERQVRNDRGARNEGGGYDWWPRSTGRSAEGGHQRPGSFRDGRSYRDDSNARDNRGVRDERPQAAGRSQSSGRFQPSGQASGPGSWRREQPQAGGHFGGSSKRSGNSASRGAAGKRRG
jgi:superfamily II DNA/RNA helicase